MHSWPDRLISVFVVHGDVTASDLSAAEAAVRFRKPVTFALSHEACHKGGNHTVDTNMAHNKTLTSSGIHNMTDWY